jgi:acyl carrier protein
MNDSDQVLQSLISLCREMEILPADLIVKDDDELFEYGVFDSMGLTILASTIEENYGVGVTTQMLIAELRTPRAIAEYIVENQHKEAETASFGQ